MCLQDASLSATASGIGDVEAMHAAVVRYELYKVTSALLQDIALCYLGAT